MSCIIKTSPKYKALSSVFGETITDSMIKAYPENIGKEDLYIPSVKELKTWLNTSKKKAYNNVVRAFQLNPYLSKEAIKFFLKGIITEKNGILFITKGYTTSGSLILKQDALQKIFKINYNIVKDLQEKYPDVFKIKDTKDENTKIVEFTQQQPRLFPNKSDQKRGTRDLTIKEKYFPTDVQKSSVVVKKIAESSHPLSKLAKQLLKYITANDVDIELVYKPIPEEVSGVSNASGLYISSSNKIYIDKDSSFKGLGSENTILHEVIHSLTNKTLTEDSHPEFEKLYEHAKNNINEYYYGLTNIDEFITAIFTDSDFIKRLQSISGTGKKYTNLLEELLDYVLNLFKITSRTGSLYEEAFAVATQVINQQYNKSLKDTIDKPTSEYVSPGFYQLKSEKGLSQPIKELDKYLLNFLKPFGVLSKEFDELKSRLGVDALGATDVLNKLIWYTKNRNEETVPEEVGHMLTMLLGKENPIIKELLSEIPKWSEYASIREQYISIYNNNEDKVKFEAVGKLLAKSLVKNYKAYGLNKNLIEKALDYINKLLDNLSLLFNNSNYSIYLADKISMNVLSGNTNFISQLADSHAKMTKNVNYKTSLENNPLASYIIKTFSKDLGNPMVGSLAIAGQNETILRPEDEPIHDLDFIVDASTENNLIKLGEKLMEAKAVPVHFGWKDSTKKYITFSYFIPKPGFTVEVVKRKANGWSEYIQVRNEKNQLVKPSPQNVIGVDFFAYGEKVKDRIIDDNFSSWNDIFRGKLMLSPNGINEIMFNRNKDQIDYILINPKNRSLKSDPIFIYYQLSNEKESQIIKSEVQKPFDKNTIPLENLEKLYNEKSPQWRTLTKSEYINSAQQYLDAVDGYQFTTEEITEQLKCL